VVLNEVSLQGEVVVVGVQNAVDSAAWNRASISEQDLTRLP
jgi:hypothetical protein